jgi:hypothetical protein
MPATEEVIDVSTLLNLKKRNNFLDYCSGGERAEAIS